MLVILGRIPKDPLAIAGFTRATDTLVAWWKSGDDREERRSRDFHAADIPAAPGIPMRTTRRPRRQSLPRARRCGPPLERTPDNRQGFRFQTATRTPSNWFVVSLRPSI
jgi:hypothetical protein